MMSWLLNVMCEIAELREKYREDEEKSRALNVLALGVKYVDIRNVYLFLRLLHNVKEVVEEVGELIPTAEEVRDWYEEAYVR